MLNWKADEQRRQARVLAQVEATLAQPLVQATTKKATGKHTTSKVKRDWTNWNVDLSVVPTNVKRVDGYFKREETDTIHNIPVETAKKPVKKATNTKVRTQDNAPLKTKAVLRIIDGKRVWEHIIPQATESQLARVKKAVEQIRNNKSYKLASYQV